MEKSQLLEKIIRAFDALIIPVKIDYIETAEKDGDNLITLHARKYTEGFKALPLDVIGNSGEFKDNFTRGIPFDIQISKESGETGTVTLFPYSREENISGSLIVQSKNKIEPGSWDIFKTVAGLVALNMDLITKIKSSEKYDKKYKADVTNMRNIQAKLFPKFKEVRGLDIASVYLPSDEITGNFIDGAFLEKEVYQLVVCDVSSYHSYSSYIGAVLRTIITTYASKKYIPSSLLEMIVDRFKKTMKGIETGVYIAVYQLNLKTGYVVFSSYGEITTLFYDSGKKSVSSLRDSQIGRELNEKKSIKDITFTLEGGDILLFYSHGLVNVKSEDGSREYGEKRLTDKLKQNSQSASIDIVHTLTESIYEFSNYSQIKDDIILISIKKESAK